MNPQSLYEKMQKILQHAGCRRVRFHDLRHTFATMALESGVDVKTLSTIIGHVSATTTLDIYSHITDDMRIRAADTIDKGLGRNNAEVEVLPVSEVEKAHPAPANAKFEPYKGKIRKSGTGCIYEINDHLWEGSFTPTHANGKRHKHCVYAKTKEECEIALADLIQMVREEIKAEKGQVYVM